MRHFALPNDGSYRPARHGILPSRARPPPHFCTPLFLSGCAILSGFRAAENRENVQPLYSATSPEFGRRPVRSSLQFFLPGNNIVTLDQRRSNFSGNARAIRSAKRSVDSRLTFFGMARSARFIDALAERAAAGVKVNAILDAQGTNKMARKT